jgi:hypothetical protein
MMGDILLRRNQTQAAIIEYEESLIWGADLNIAYFPLARLILVSETTIILIPKVGY